MLVSGVGLLERDVAADPARGADVEVAVEVGHGARADGGRVQVPGARHDGRPGQQAELGRRRPGASPPSTLPVGTSSGRVDALRPANSISDVVVGDGVDVAVVGHPVQRDGVVRGAGQTGEAQVQVVDRLEEHRGRRVDVGALLAQEVDVAHRVLARQARDAAGAAHPAGQLGGGVALDVERAADRLADRVAPRESIQMMAGRWRRPAVVDGHGARPLRGAAHADDPLRAPRRCRPARARADATMASHQAWGDCSAPPSSVRSIPTAWKAWATIRPVAEKTATLGPPVPRSTART